MGRLKRLHRERVIAKLEPPFRSTGTAWVPKPLRCRKCNSVVPFVEARNHIRECWPMEIKDNEPIPDSVPMQYLNGQKQYNADGTLP